MLSWLFGEQAEIRGLNKDARSIVRSTREGRTPTTQAAMARATLRALAEAAARVEEKGDEAEGIRLLRTAHREARRQRRDVELTGYTFAIILTRARALGEAADPARAEVQSFLDDWKHVLDEEEPPESHMRF